MNVEKPAAGTEPADKKNSGLGKSAIVEVPFTDLDKSETLNDTPEAFSSGAAGRYRTMDAFASDPLKEEPVQADPASVETPATGAARQKWEEEEEEEKSERSSRNLIILAVILVFVLITGGIIYYAMNREISQGKNQIASLSGQVNALNSEILRLDRNQKVLAVLSAKDLRTVNLDGADGNPGGFGKLSLLQNGNEGVIQFYNMPALKDSQVYQLWLSSKGKYYSLGTFKTKRDIEYFPFSVPEVEQDKIDSYIVTLESTDGRTTPSDKIYLMTTSNSR
jgi:cell division protein FtsL